MNTKFAKQNFFVTLSQHTAHWFHVFLDLTLNLQNYKLILIVDTRYLTIRCFTSDNRRTIHRKWPSSYQTPSLKGCRKILLTKKCLTQRKLNTRMR